MRGKAIRYSEAEFAWLEEHRTLPISDYHADFVAQFGRADVTAANLHALRKRKGWRTGRTGHFERGQESWNKGKKCPPGKGGNHPNARRTQFRKGERTGIARENYKPIGYERISEDGYRERKVNDDLPFKDRWQMVHRIEWEAANGPIPEGHALKCLDGDRLNCDPSNWEPVPRGVLGRLNGGRCRETIPYDEAPADLKPTLMASAKLKHAIQEVREAKRQSDAGAV